MAVFNTGIASQTQAKAFKQNYDNENRGKGSNLSSRFKKRKYIPSCHEHAPLFALSSIAILFTFSYSNIPASFLHHGKEIRL